LIPGDARDEISAGPIRLNLAQRRVSCMGRESHLTPRLVHLLRLMIERKGRLLTREFLMKKVWYTDYIGDTRTIDVHMSWLRKAVEPDPQNPRFIKTIRGLGYRLDLPRE
jgi:DNA-binding response OmpR family regulator